MNDSNPRLIFSDAAGIRGVRACHTARLTRRSDGASILLHAIDPAVEPRLTATAFDSEAPDFRRPFVTRITWIAENHGMLFLAEPLPPAIPLLDVWGQVLQNTPEQAVQVVRELTRQLGQALEPLHAARQTHGAVGVENIVLTTSGIYGLLVARLATPDDWLWLRPRTHETPHGERRDDELHHPHLSESVEEVVVDLANFAATTNVLSHSQWLELEALQEQEVRRTHSRRTIELNPMSSR